MVDVYFFQQRAFYNAGGLVHALYRGWLKPILLNVRVLFVFLQGAFDARVLDIWMNNICWLRSFFEMFFRRIYMCCSPSLFVFWRYKDLALLDFLKSKFFDKFVRAEDYVCAKNAFGSYQSIVANARFSSEIKCHILRKQFQSRSTFGYWKGQIFRWGSAFGAPQHSWKRSGIRLSSTKRRTTSDTVIPSFLAYTRSQASWGSVKTTDWRVPMCTSLAPYFGAVKWP